MDDTGVIRSAALTDDATYHVRDRVAEARERARANPPSEDEVERLRAKSQALQQIVRRNLAVSRRGARTFIGCAPRQGEAATLVRIVNKMAAGSACRVLTELGRAANAGDRPDVDWLADQLAVHYDDAQKLAEFIGEAFDAAMAEVTRPDAPIVLARLRVLLEQHAAKWLEIADVAPPAPMSDTHVLAAPSPANAPPARDLPPLREVAAA